MAFTAFRNTKLRSDRLSRIETINSIIREYQANGYRLTLRQLYYQLVSRDIIPNRQKEYANLSSLLTDGRMCGLIDWNAIEDRLRVPSSPTSFESPKQILEVAIKSYMKPRMDNQNVYIEVWVEKDALSGVLRRVTEPFHVPIMVNRGYSSASAMYDAYCRFKSEFKRNKEILILYLGDFDPSGIDMIRDVEQRILEFFVGRDYKYKDTGKDLEAKDFRRAADAMGLHFEVRPIALTKAQIDEHAPPPNPAKQTDSRFQKFATEYGTTSWEVDALRPEVLDGILRAEIESAIDMDRLKIILREEKKDVKKLEALKTYL